MSRGRFALLVGGAFVTGAILSGVAVFALLTAKTSDMLIGSTRLSSAAGVSASIAVLGPLRRGDTPQAIEMLEQMLDANVLSLGALSPEQRTDVEERNLRRANEYRSQFPRKTDNAEVDAVVRRLLESTKSKSQ